MNGPWFLASAAPLLFGVGLGAWFPSLSIPLSWWMGARVVGSAALLITFALYSAPYFRGKPKFSLGWAMLLPALGVFAYMYLPRAALWIFGVAGAALTLRFSKTKGMTAFSERHRKRLVSAFLVLLVITGFASWQESAFKRQMVIDLRDRRDYRGAWDLMNSIPAARPRREARRDARYFQDPSHFEHPDYPVVQFFHPWLHLERADYQYESGSIERARMSYGHARMWAAREPDPTLRSQYMRAIYLGAAWRGLFLGFPNTTHIPDEYVYRTTVEGLRFLNSPIEGILAIGPEELERRLEETRLRARGQYFTSGHRSLLGNIASAGELDVARHAIRMMVLSTQLGPLPRATDQRALIYLLAYVHDLGFHREVVHYAESLLNASQRESLRIEIDGRAYFDLRPAGGARLALAHADEGNLHEARAVLQEVRSAFAGALFAAAQPSKEADERRRWHNAAVDTIDVLKAWLYEAPESAWRQEVEQALNQFEEKLRCHNENAPAARARSRGAIAEAETPRTGVATREFAVTLWFGFSLFPLAAIFFWRPEKGSWSDDRDPAERDVQHNFPETLAAIAVRPLSPRTLVGGAAAIVGVGFGLMLALQSIIPLVVWSFVRWTATGMLIYLFGEYTASEFRGRFRFSGRWLLSLITFIVFLIAVVPPSPSSVGTLIIFGIPGLLMALTDHNLGERHFKSLLAGLLLVLATTFALASIESAIKSARAINRQYEEDYVGAQQMVDSIPLLTTRQTTRSEIRYLDEPSPPVHASNLGRSFAHPLTYVRRADDISKDGNVDGAREMYRAARKRAARESDPVRRSKYFAAIYISEAWNGLHSGMPSEKEIPSKEIRRKTLTDIGYLIGPVETLMTLHPSYIERLQREASTRANESLDLAWLRNVAAAGEMKAARHIIKLIITFPSYQIWVVPWRGHLVNRLAAIYALGFHHEVIEQAQLLLSDDERRALLREIEKRPRIVDPAKTAKVGLALLGSTNSFGGRNVLRHLVEYFQTMKREQDRPKAEGDDRYQDLLMTIDALRRWIEGNAASRWRSDVQRALDDLIRCLPTITGPSNAADLIGASYHRQLSTPTYTPTQSSRPAWRPLRPDITGSSGLTLSTCS